MRRGYRRYGGYRKRRTHRNYHAHKSYGHRKSSAGALPLATVCLILLASIFWWLFPIGVVIGIIYCVVKISNYKKSAYYSVTKNSYLSVLFNKGRYGEYLTYQYLRHYEEQGARFLFNVYIPKGNGETTEIDVLMISTKGIFVFESKNYSGWIFGSEHQQQWYQTLPSGRKSHKERFYNPIMQNNTHIRHLKAILGEYIPVRSVIVFSERCTLKSVEIQSRDISVIKRNDVAATIYDIYSQTPADLLSGESISDIYDMLYPFTQVDERTKTQHIENINNKVKGIQSQQTKPQVATPVVAVVNNAETNPAAVAPEAKETVGEITVDEEPKAETVETPETESAETTLSEQQTLLCPRCKGKLVLRTATKGDNAGKQFYGCTNYPKCKYIQNLTPDIEK